MDILHKIVFVYANFNFFDGITGQPLNQKMAVEARKLEMDFFRWMNVYDKVTRQEATA